MHTIILLGNNDYTYKTHFKKFIHLLFLKTNSKFPGLTYLPNLAVTMNICPSNSQCMRTDQSSQETKCKSTFQHLSGHT